jgi:DNA repair protein RecO (recombination protein O)
MSMTGAAVVLRATDFSESDRILNVMTADHGRLALFVPGALKSKRRFAQALEPLARFEGEFISRPRSTLKRLGAFTFIDSGWRWRRDFARLVQGLSAVEAVHKLTLEGDPQPRVFALLWEWLEGRGQEPVGTRSNAPTGMALPVFLLRLLNQLGFLPRLNGCVRCNRTLPAPAAESPCWFVAHEGGLICHDCFSSVYPGGSPHPPLSRAALKPLQQVLFGGIAEARIRLSAPHLKELHRLAFDMAESISGGDLRCARLLDVLFPTEVSDEPRQRARTA